VKVTRAFQILVTDELVKRDEWLNKENRMRIKQALVKRLCRILVKRHCESILELPEGNSDDKSKMEHSTMVKRNS